MYQANRKGDADGATAFQDLLKKEILQAIRCEDTQEAFFHRLLRFLMAANQDYEVKSQVPSPDEFVVVSRLRYDLDNAIVLEGKTASSLAEMTKLSEKAVKQTEPMRTVMNLLREEYEKIYTYGVAFFGKICKVCAGEVYTQSDLDHLLTQKAYGITGQF